MIGPMVVTIYKCQRYSAAPVWTCYGPGAMGCAHTPWGALADMLATWARRGKPGPGPEALPSGPDWVITRITPRRDAGRRAVWIEGENLNRPIGERAIYWGLDDVDVLRRDPRFEILPTCEIDPGVPGERIAS